MHTGEQHVHRWIIQPNKGRRYSCKDNESPNVCWHISKMDCDTVWVYFVPAPLFPSLCFSRTCTWSARTKTAWWPLCRSGTKMKPITCTCPTHQGSITPWPSRTWWAASAPRATSWWIFMRSGHIIIHVITQGMKSVCVSGGKILFELLIPHDITVVSNHYIRAAHWKGSLCRCSILWLMSNGGPCHNGTNNS